jgi:hypothetical protein
LSALNVDSISVYHSDLVKAGIIIGGANVREMIIKAAIKTPVAPETITFLDP